LADFRWSSYPGYQRAASASSWICYDRVLGALANHPRQGRRAYVRLVSAAIGKPPPSPFAQAIGGLLLGSTQFVERMRRSLAARAPDRALPELTKLRHRPSLAEIGAAVACHFGADDRKRNHAMHWQPGTRNDDASRAVAAYLARREFGYSAAEVAQALAYRSHGSVRNAILRIEQGGTELRRCLATLRAVLAND
jgi:hypothetical protein